MADKLDVVLAEYHRAIEDRKLFTWGNVLANDRDPEGERLRVADPGIRRGEYGVLTLLSNGTYAYVLDDCSTKVQGLGVGETVTETFNYLASDAMCDLRVKAKEVFAAQAQVAVQEHFAALPAASRRFADMSRKL